jgi:hypothetical protein
MREISLNMMDIMQNSLDAKATYIQIHILEEVDENKIVVEIIDNGIGIEEANLSRVFDPFFTSRKTRKVGLGLSMFKSTCESCGGSLQLKSKVGEGTRVTGILKYNHLDRPPIGRVEDTIISVLINPQVNIEYIHKAKNSTFIFNSRKIKEIIGETIDAEVLNWIREYIRDGLQMIEANLWS